MLPNFLIVGAARSGTTALANMLKLHPDVFMPELKEPRYFSSIDQTYPHCGKGDWSIDSQIIKSFDEYKNLFEAANSIRVGESSPDYLYFHKSAAEYIKKEIGDVQIIIILREPVERAFSAYSHIKRDKRELLSFSDALKAEQDRVDQNYDFLWHYKRGSLYYDQVNSYMNTFSKVQVIFQDDLKSKPKDTLKEVFDFLGLEEGVSIDTSLEYNKSGNPTNAFASLILNRDSKFGVLLRESLKRLLPRQLLERVASRFIEKEVLDEEIGQDLSEIFLEDVTKLESLLNTDLSRWKSK